MEGLDEAQVYTILEFCDRLDSQNKGKKDFIDTSRKRASIQQKRTLVTDFRQSNRHPELGIK